MTGSIISSRWSEGNVSDLKGGILLSVVILVDTESTLLQAAASIVHKVMIFSIIIYSLLF